MYKRSFLFWLAWQPQICTYMSTWTLCTHLARIFAENIPVKFVELVTQEDFPSSQTVDDGGATYTR